MSAEQERFHILRRRAPRDPLDYKWRRTPRTRLRTGPAHRTSGIPGINVPAFLRRKVHRFAVLPILGRIRRVELVEFNFVTRKIFLVSPVVMIHKFLRGDAPLACIDLNGRAVGVRRADVHDVTIYEAKEAHEYIGLHVLHEVTYVDVSICVRQGAGNKY
jgi:hypothetical protein